MMHRAQYLVYYIAGFLVLIAGSFVMQSWLTYGLDIVYMQQRRIIAREVMRFGMLAILAIISPKTFFRRISQWKWLLIVLLVLIGWGVGHSLRMGETLHQLIVGFKYDMYPFVVLTSTTWLGFRGGQYLSKQSLLTIHKIIFHLLFRLLIIGWLRQGLKWFFPDIFLSYMGYGGLGDFVPGQAPPLYYLTGSGGFPRLSGLFAGPNVLGFLLVAFASYRSAAVNFFRHRWQMILFTVLYVVSLFMTLSRGAVVAFGIQMIAGIILLRKISRARKILFSLFVGLVTWHFVGIIQQRKIGSTQTHESAWSTARRVIQDNPRGYGLGMSGPAQHYAPDYQERPQHDLSMVESVYIQWVVNMGRLGLGLVMFFLLIWCGYVRQSIQRSRSTGDDEDTFLSLLMVLMSLGFGGLLVEGLVLHVFIDSMVNYLFFIPYGMTVGFVGVYRHR